MVEGGDECLIALRLLLHLPERLDRIPVTIPGRVLEPAEKDRVELAMGLLHHRPEVERRGELGEVEHPVDLPVSIVDVDRVLKERGELRQGHLVFVCQLAFEVGEVPLHLRAEAIAPPADELVAVHGQNPIEVLADLGFVLGIERDSGPVPGAVLHRVDFHSWVGRDGRGVQVAVDFLGDPIDGERRSEPTEHVVAREPPATDVEEHRAERVRTVQVVVDPEQFLLVLRLPLDREVLVTEELAKHLFLDDYRHCRCLHWAWTLRRYRPIRRNFIRRWCRRMASNRAPVSLNTSRH